MLIWNAMKPTPEDWRRLEAYDRNTFLLAVLFFVIIPSLILVLG